jgi:hypothetical protein
MSYTKSLEKQNTELQERLAEVEHECSYWKPHWRVDEEENVHYYETTSNLFGFVRFNKLWIANIASTIKINGYQKKFKRLEDAKRWVEYETRFPSQDKITPITYSSSESSVSSGP